MVRRMTITLVTVTAVAGIGLYALPGGHARAATPALASGPLNSLAASPGPVTSSSLNTLALAAASESGDSTPSSIQYVDTTHQLAEEATSGDGDPTDTNTPVALIVETGHFTAYAAQVGPGNALPTGSELILVVDLATSDVTDWGVTNLNPDLSSLGSIEVLR